MAKKRPNTPKKIQGRPPGKSGTTSVTPEKLDEIAALVRQYAASYAEAAASMREYGIDEVEVTGLSSVYDKSLEILRGNTFKVKQIVADHADAVRWTAIADKPSSYVVEPSEIDEANPKARKPEK